MVSNKFICAWSGGIIASHQLVFFLLFDRQLFLYHEGIGTKHSGYLARGHDRK